MAEQLHIEGESMRPFLRPGEPIGVQWLEADLAPLRNGELAVFRAQSGEWIVHRVLKREADGGYQIKGDASLICDGVSSQQIFGKVVTVRGVPFSATALDRGIAVFSSAASRAPLRLVRAVAKRVVFAFGLLRRLLP